ncbi:sugar ABC transporter permease [Devosia sp. BK]|uniref:carbohydrate ABC transporter permease n=1 Tax=Devosia sp. BK TaxID=2871706 RepID=UPI00293A8480|nr:sugar ABC transporter permease [Devosia sp. BK]MDV3251304.1 sugar ABC transporter permease [Devosia sp. BK]
MTASAVATLKTQRRSLYPGWFYAPAAVVYSMLFLAPTFASLYFSLTRWTLFDATFIGFDNFAQFFREPFLIQGLVNTVIYAVITSGLKVVIGMLLAVMLTSQIMARGYLRSVIFFPVLVSTIGVGMTFTVLMHPTMGMINQTLAMIGIKGPGWLVDPKLALFSVALVDVWKGVGLATVIYIAGLVAIPKDYYEAARIDGATKLQNFFYVTLPLSRPATATVITLSFIGGLRTFDLIWAMTKGGPGFASDTVASVIYKQYQAGFYGLSTAGNVVLFILIAVLVVPLTMVLNRKQGHE